MENRCIARAYRGRPLDRIAVGRTDKLIYINVPETTKKSVNAMTGAVGFPQDAVYQADDDLLNKLVTAFDSADWDALEGLWDDAKPLDPGGLDRR